MRSTTFFGAVVLVSLVGCATAVMPDGAAPDINTDAVNDAGATSNDNSYSNASDGGSTTPTSDGGKSTTPPPKSDGGSTSTGSCSFTGALATYDFSGESGNQTSTAATSTATGVTAGDVKRADTLTAVSGSDSMNASGWSTATHVDTTKYFTLSITPPSACKLDVSSITLDTSASGSGPGAGSLATSDDSFSSKVAFTPGAASTPSLSVSGSSSAVEIRIYGYGASSAAGTMRMQSSLVVTGSLL